MALSDLQANIANDLTRADLTSQIASAVNDAIKFYEPSRFWFNVTRSLTFPTVVNQQPYTGSDLAQIPNIIRIDKLWLNSPGSIYALDWYEPDEFEWLIPLQGGGKPTVYTYIDQQILLWPTPNSTAFTLRPHMHYRLAALVQPTDTNAWCTNAEQLIRAHAKLLLYTNVLEDTDGAARMQGEIQAFKDKLDYETSARMATGRIRGTEF